MFLLFIVDAISRKHPSISVSGFHSDSNTLYDINNKSDFKQMLFSNARFRSLFCVKRKTQDQYSAGWHSYIDFCEGVLECSPLFYNRFQEWEGDDMQNNGIRYEVVVFTAFAEYLIINNNKNGHLICSYFTAVRWNLVQSGINIDFLKDPLIKSGRAALEKLNRLNKSLEEKRFPATAEFVATLSDDLMSLGTYEGFSMAVGAMLGFTCMLRVHEYLHEAPKSIEVDLDEPDDYHTIRARDVLFEFRSKDILGHECSTFVPPAEVHLHSIDNLVAMDFIVPSSKTDQEGNGIPFHVPRMKVSSSVAFDLVKTAYQWSYCARPSGLSPFLSWNDGLKWPSYRKFNVAIKKIAGKMGLPTNKATSHCLRIGGATAMSAAGLPDHLIMIYGRWKSLAFLLYARKSRATSSMAVAAITNPLNLSSNDIVRSYRQQVSFSDKIEQTS